jgi:aerobic carbon-monoxide dehydrogenase medium subunit
VKASAFQYYDPRTQEELIALLARLDDAKLLAGGQSLMPMMNYRILAPAHLIDLNQVAGMSGISSVQDRIEIGALTRQRVALVHPLIAEKVPVLCKALEHVGHIQTRSRGTIGGSCCHLDPAAEVPAIMALYDAEFNVLGPAGGRVVASAEWFQGFLQSALDEREVLQSISFKPWGEGAIAHGFGFNEYAQRHGDFAIAGAGCLVDLDSAGSIARIALVVFGLESAPLRLRALEQQLVGAKPDENAIASAVASLQGVEALSDVHIAADYRHRIAGVTLRRAMQAAFAVAEQK